MLAITIANLGNKGKEGAVCRPPPSRTHRKRSRPEVINSLAPTAGTGFAFDLIPPRVT